MNINLSNFEYEIDVKVFEGCNFSEHKIPILLIKQFLKNLIFLL